MNLFRAKLNDVVTPEISLNTELDIENVVQNITHAIHAAVWQAMLNSEQKRIVNKYPLIVKQKRSEKIKTRKRWQLTGAASYKQQCNKLLKKLKKLLHKLRNESIQEYITELTLQK